jgi:molecular chaperone GrpE
MFDTENNHNDFHDNEQEHYEQDNQEHEQECEDNENPQFDECASDEYKKELEHFKKRCHYLAAEFDNYQKRSEKEKAQWTPLAQARVLKDMLPIVDDFERALSESLRHDVSEDVTSHVKGFEMILSSFQKMLESYGVREISDISSFNPEHHEAVMQVQSDDVESGDVVEILQKGYIFKDHVLRPAKVSVAQ